MSWNLLINLVSHHITLQNINIPNCWIFVEGRNLNFVLKIFTYISSWIIERINDCGVNYILIHVHGQVKLFYSTTSWINDHGVRDILIHFQEHVWKLENEFHVPAHNITKYTYSKSLNFCWVTKLKLCTQTF